MAAQGKLVAGGTPIAASTQELERNQIATPTTLLQPASPAFRLSDAFQKFDPSALAGEVTTLQNQVTTLQSQVATLQAQMAAVQQVINALNMVQLEVATGTTFIDGRMIYVRSFYFASGFSQPGVTISHAHGIDALYWMVDAFAVDNGGGAGAYNFILNYINTMDTVGDGINFWVDGTNINVTSAPSANRSADPVVMTLRYTCTNR